MNKTKVQRRIGRLLLLFMVLSIVSIGPVAYAEVEYEPFDESLHNEMETDIESPETESPDSKEESEIRMMNVEEEEPEEESEELEEEEEEVDSSESEEVPLDILDPLRIEAITAIYLNGQGGDDSNDGSTPETAVKTFGRAYEISKENLGITTIYVTGTTSIDGDITLEETNAKILRDPSFNGYVFKVPANATATLYNIVIDGNSDENKNIEKSLIQVNSGATLNIGENATIRNNQIKDIKNTATAGGGIYADRAIINMIGGSVEDNKAVYGGGICLYKSTMNFSGGTVQNNTAKLCHDTSTDPEQYYSAGGGILANGGSTINLLSNNAQVLNNYADEVGGGISVGSNQWGPTNTLNMDGGLIDGNSAGSSGGGIFIQAKYFSGGPSKAYINAGRITNNAMDGSGVLNKAFGGGGIYVNGANKNYGVNGSNGELHLKNAIIKANTAEWQGAGYASCPILETEIHITDGVAMYQNKPSSLIGRELFIYRDGPGDGYGLHSGEPKITLYKYMLGGVVR